MQYRRAKSPGSCYFFTLVTHNRRSFLCEPENVDLLRDCFKRVMSKHPFKIDAIVILPNHLHCIWTLPPGDADYSTRWRLIKSWFSRRCDVKYLGQVSASRKDKGEKAIWQRRFWEHLIRDEQDFNNHVDYIHYNPVHHRLVLSPKDWQYSSFHRYVQRGVYDLDWGVSGECWVSLSLKRHLLQRREPPQRSGSPTYGRAIALMYNDALLENPQRALYVKIILIKKNNQNVEKNESKTLQNRGFLGL